MPATGCACERFKGAKHASDSRVVALNVLHAIPIMGFVSNQPVPAFILPEWSLSAQCLVDDVRRITFPGVQDLVLRMAGESFEENMHVVRHDDESVEPISGSIEVVQS